MTTPANVQRVAAYNVCLDEQHRLLVCRLSAITEAAGAWTLPGGGVEFGEHPEQTAIRELAEETGLTGRVAELLAVDSAVRAPEATTGIAGYHAIRIFYRTLVEPGEILHETTGSTDRAAWCTRAELDRMPLVGTSERGVRLAYGDRR